MGELNLYITTSAVKRGLPMVLCRQVKKTKRKEYFAQSINEFTFIVFFLRYYMQGLNGKDKKKLHVHKGKKRRWSLHLLNHSQINLYTGQNKCNRKKTWGKKEKKEKEKKRKKSVVLYINKLQLQL